MGAGGADTVRADAWARIAVDAAFARLLDRTGVVCAVVHWVKEQAAGTASPRADARLARFLDRLARPPGA